MHRIRVRPAQAVVAEQRLHVGVSRHQPGFVPGHGAHARDGVLNLELAVEERDV
jgi:hypothetical protein